MLQKQSEQKNGLDCRRRKKENCELIWKHACRLTVAVRLVRGVIAQRRKGKLVPRECL